MGKVLRASVFLYGVSTWVLVLQFFRTQNKLPFPDLDRD
jgi:hypothetical protein